MSIEPQLNVLTALPAKDFKEIFLRKLKEGSIVTVSVLDKLQNNTLLLNIDSQTFLGTARQDLTKGTKFLAKVSRVSPRLIMELMEPLPKDSPVLLEEKLKAETAKMGMMLNEKSISIINAMKDASIKLSKNNLQEFSKNITDDMLNSPSKLKAAAKFFRSNIPAEAPLIEKTENLLNLETDILNKLPAKISSLNKMIQQLPAEQQNLLAPQTENLNNLLEKITLSNTSDSAHIAETINNIRSTHPLYHEAAAMKEMAELLTDTNKLPENVKHYVKELESISNKVKELLNNSSPAEKPLSQLESLLSATREMPAFKNPEQIFSEKLSPETTPQPEKELLHQLLRHSDLLTESLKKIQESNQDLNTEKLLTEAEKKTEQLLDKLLPEIKENTSLKNHLSERADLLKNQLTQNDLKTDINDLRDTFNQLKAHQNIKEKLSELQSSLEKMVKNDPALEKMSEFKEIRENLRDLLTEIKSEQLKESLRQLAPQMPDYLAIPLILPEGKGTLNIIFEQMKNSAASDKSNKFFSVYFSMELSEIGYFEISLLDNSKNLDLTFFSASDSVRDLFEKGAEELKDKLLKLPISSVNLRTLKQEEKSSSPLNAEQQQAEKTNQTGIDIIT